MLKEIAGYLGKYKKDVCMSPFAMVGEVVCEMLIPVLMGKLVDNGIYAGNTSYVLHLGVWMLLVAVAGFFSGCAGRCSSTSRSSPSRTSITSARRAS